MNIPQDEIRHYPSKNSFYEFITYGTKYADIKTDLELKLKIKFKPIMVIHRETHNIPYKIITKEEAEKIVENWKISLL